MTYAIHGPVVFNGPSGSFLNSGDLQSRRPVLRHGASVETALVTCHPQMRTKKGYGSEFEGENEHLPLSTMVYRGLPETQGPIHPFVPCQKRRF